MSGLTCLTVQDSSNGVHEKTTRASNVRHHGIHDTVAAPQKNDTLVNITVHELSGISCLSPDLSESVSLHAQGRMHTSFLPVVALASFGEAVNDASETVGSVSRKYAVSKRIKFVSSAERRSEKKATILWEDTSNGVVRTCASSSEKDDSNLKENFSETTCVTSNRENDETRGKDIGNVKGRAHATNVLSTSYTYRPSYPEDPLRLLKDPSNGATSNEAYAGSFCHGTNCVSLCISLQLSNETVTVGRADVVLPRSDQENLQQKTIEIPLDIILPISYHQCKNCKSHHHREDFVSFTDISNIGSASSAKKKRKNHGIFSMFKMNRKGRRNGIQKGTESRLLGCREGNCTALHHRFAFKADPSRVFCISSNSYLRVTLDFEKVSDISAHPLSSPFDCNKSQSTAVDDSITYVLCDTRDSPRYYKGGLQNIEVMIPTVDRPKTAIMFQKSRHCSTGRDDTVKNLEPGSSDSHGNEQENKALVGDMKLYQQLRRSFDRLLGRCFTEQSLKDTTSCENYLDPSDWPSLKYKDDVTDQQTTITSEKIPIQSTLNGTQGEIERLGDKDRHAIFNSFTKDDETFYSSSRTYEDDTVMTMHEYTSAVRNYAEEIGMQLDDAFKLWEVGLGLRTAESAFASLTYDDNLSTWGNSFATTSMSMATPRPIGGIRGRVRFERDDETLRGYSFTTASMSMATPRPTAGKFHRGRVWLERDDDTSTLRGYSFATTSMSMATPKPNGTKIHRGRVWFDRDDDASTLRGYSFATASMSMATPRPKALKTQLGPVTLDENSYTIAPLSTPRHADGATGCGVSHMEFC